MYSVWFLRKEQDQHNFLSFASFFPFYPTEEPENQNFEKTKKHLQEILSFYTCLA